MYCILNKVRWWPPSSWHLTSVGTRGGTKLTPSLFFSKTVMTYVVSFTYIMVTSFKKLRLFSHRFFITKTIFLPLRETLSAGRVKLFAETSELFTHTVAMRKGIFFKIYFGLREYISNCNGSMHSGWMLYTVYQIQYYYKQGGS